MRRLMQWLVALFMTLALLPGTGFASGPSRVYVVRIDQMQSIDPAAAQVVARALETAQADPQAAAVAIRINTPGGLLDSAMIIKDDLMSSPVKTLAFVEGSALSAGALVATAAEDLYMMPGSTIGAAEPRAAGSTEAADYKVLSAVVGEFRAAAAHRGRNPDLAQAMVDREAKVPGQTTELLVMTTEEAVAQGYADGAARSLDEALALAGITDYSLVNVPMTLSEQTGRILTTPWVAVLLLVVGIIAIGIEVMKPGLTFPGMLGITCLGLFFLGNILVGTAGGLELVLAIIGIILIVIELFVPGGIFGIGGAVLVAASIFLAVPTPQQALMYLTWAALAFLVVLFGLVRTIGKRGLGRFLTLEKSAQGWAPARTELAALVGQEGKALTVLRPAGTAQFGDLKVDVVTEGEFLPAGVSVRVVQVEGTRVVVRRADPEK